MEERKIVLKSGYYGMIFKRDDIPFFNDLEKTNKIVLIEDKEYSVYEAPDWNIAQKVDAFMGNDELGFDIDDHLIKDDIKI
ncbi:MAG: hypothetical protein PHD03_03440 [Bacilli bacterium]|jgi:hypothetical protein|nr:hypothetical protein [Bacilli bacterium]